MPTKLELNARWCFTQNELVINFPDSQSALEYQRANSEGRIFANSNKNVYLPRPEGLRAIRGSSQGIKYCLVLEFRSEKAAFAWHSRSKISTIYPDHRHRPERAKTCVYINCEVKKEEFVTANNEGIRLWECLK